MSNLRIKPFFAWSHWRRVFTLSLCFTLLAGTTLNASAYHLTKVRNKSFEKDGNKDGIPNAWTPLVGLNAKSKRVCNKAKHKKCSFKMVADGSSQLLSQEIPDSSGGVGVEVTISGWIKNKDLGGAGYTELRVILFQTDGGFQLCSAVKIIAGTFPFTKYENVCVSSESFDSMRVDLFTNAGSGKVWFDKVKLTAVCLVCL